MPYLALSYFERAVHYSPDHPEGTVGLCNILLDISSEKLAPLPTYQPLIPAGTAPTPPTSTISVIETVRTAMTASFDPMSHAHKPYESHDAHPSVVHNGFSKLSPLGLPKSPATPSEMNPPIQNNNQSDKAHQISLLAARDRTHALLSSLTKLGTGWNFSEAWFALARAYEESGQADKAREALWWCVELEEVRSVRRWGEVSGSGGGGYVL
jgi:hypothetical protein